MNVKNVLIIVKPVILQVNAFCVMIIPIEFLHHNVHVKMDIIIQELYLYVSNVNILVKIVMEIIHVFIFY